MPTLPSASTRSNARRPLGGAVAPRRSRAASKGVQTRSTIVDAALALASHVGLEGLSIGVLAETICMSKSGVFAHFGSREELQISVLKAYHQRFEEEVFHPALREPRGLPRLRELFRLWMRRTAVEIDSGCLYIAGAVEFDDRPGPVRDALVEMVQLWQAAIRRAVGLAVETGHLRPDTDAEQLAFELHGLILALHYDARFLRNPQALQRAQQGFDNLIARVSVDPASTATPSPSWAVAQAGG